MERREGEKEMRHGEKREGDETRRKERRR